MPRRSSLDPFSPPPDDDPFAADPPAFVTARGVSAAGIESRPAIARPLVDRDPFASPDETSEYAVGGASFDDLLRRARRQGFLAGGLAGGAAAATFVAVTWLLVGTASVPTMEVRGELRAAEVDADVAPLAGPGTPLDPAPPAPAPAARAAVPAADPAPSAPPSPRRPRPGVAASDEAPRPGPAAVAPLAEEPPRVEGAGATPAPPPETEAAHAADVAAADAGPAEALAAAAPEAGPADAPAVERPRAPGEREVMAALREHGEAIDECVALATGPEGDVRGRRFRLLVAIEPGGAVLDARVLDPGVEATPLGGCLVGVARELAFPPFEGEAVEVELPVRYGRSG